MGKKLQGAKLRAKKRALQAVEELQEQQADDVAHASVRALDPIDLFVIDTAGATNRKKGYTKNNKDNNIKKTTPVAAAAAAYSNSTKAVTVVKKALSVKNKSSNLTVKDQKQVDRLLQLYNHSAEKLALLAEKGRWILNHQRVQRCRQGGPTNAQFDLWCDEQRDDHQNPNNNKKTNNINSTRKVGDNHDANGGVKEDNDCKGKFASNDDDNNHNQESESAGVLASIGIAKDASKEGERKCGGTMEQDKTKPDNDHPSKTKAKTTATTATTTTTKAARKTAMESNTQTSAKKRSRQSKNKKKKRMTSSDPSQQQRLALTTSATATTPVPQVVAIDVARAGQSYHPDPVAHQRVLQTALQVEWRREQAIRYEQSPISAGMLPETRALLVGDTDSSDDDDHDDEQEQDDANHERNDNEKTVPTSTMMILPKRLEKFTRAQRNKQKRIRQAALEQDEQKRLKRMHNQVAEIPRFAKELKEMAHQREERRQRRELLLLEQERQLTRGKNLEIKMSQRNPIQALAIPVVLTEQVGATATTTADPAIVPPATETTPTTTMKAMVTTTLSDGPSTTGVTAPTTTTATMATSLRRLRPRGNLLQDRFVSLIDRNMGAPNIQRKAITSEPLHHQTKRRRLAYKGHKNNQGKGTNFEILG